MAGSAPATGQRTLRPVVNRQRCHANGFTLAELVVSVGVYVLWFSYLRSFLTVRTSQRSATNEWMRTHKHANGLIGSQSM